MQDRTRSSHYVPLSEILSNQFPIHGNAPKFTPVHSSDVVDTMYGLNPSILPLFHRINTNIKYQVDEICHVIKNLSQEFSKFIKDSLDGYEWKIRDQIYQVAVLWGVNTERSMQRVYKYSEEHFEIGFPFGLNIHITEILSEYLDAIHNLSDSIVNFIHNLPGGQELKQWMNFKELNKHLTDPEILRRYYFLENMKSFSMKKPKYINWILAILIVFSISFFLSSILFCIYLLFEITPHRVFTFVLKWNNIILILLLSIFHGYIMFESTNDKSKLHNNKLETNDIKSNIYDFKSPKNKNPPTINITSQDSNNPEKDKIFSPRASRIKSNEIYSSSILSPHRLASNRKNIESVKSPLHSHPSISSNQNNNQSNHNNNINSPKQYHDARASIFQWFHVEDSIQNVTGIKKQGKKRGQPKFLLAIFGGIQFLVGSFCVFPVDQWIDKSSPFHDFIHYLFPFVVMSLISIATYCILSLGMLFSLSSIVSFAMDFYEFTTFPSLRNEFIQNKKYKFEKLNSDEDFERKHFPRNK